MDPADGFLELKELTCSLWYLQGYRARTLCKEARGAALIAAHWLVFSQLPRCTRTHGLGLYLWEPRLVLLRLHLLLILFLPSLALQLPLLTTSRLIQWPVLFLLVLG